MSSIAPSSQYLVAKIQTKGDFLILLIGLYTDNPFLVCIPIKILFKDIENNAMFRALDTKLERGTKLFGRLSESFLEIDVSLDLPSYDVIAVDPCTIDQCVKDYLPGIYSFNEIVSIRSLWEFGEIKMVASFLAESGCSQSKRSEVDTMSSVERAFIPLVLSCETQHITEKIPVIKGTGKKRKTRTPET